MVNDINNDLNVLNHIIQILEGKTPTAMMGSSELKREEVIKEVENLKKVFKTSCKKLLNIMTSEESEKLNMTTIMSLFAEDKKNEILNLLKK